ncbi:MAG: hypothetical protein K6T94_08430, partial [Paenibacillus sp.]|nr:hypothetical protein [Paenibacillus sp.]
MRIFSVLLACLIVMSIGSPVFAGGTDKGDSWDKSSLVFTISNGECSIVTADVQNHGSGNMVGEVTWELYYALTGNPKDGTIIATGSVGPLNSGVTQTLSYNPNNIAGNYMFKAYQISGHPGTGELWSNMVQIVKCTTPTPTPTPTATTEVTPTPTATTEVTPTPTATTEVTPTPT